MAESAAKAIRDALASVGRDVTARSGGDHLTVVARPAQQGRKSIEIVYEQIRPVFR
jgi:hypothetical protein